jgi:sirohydrochlorin cobaltochelatase
MNGKRALVLMAHGSRNTTSNREVEELTTEVAKSLPVMVTHAFLDVLPPALPETIDRLVRENIKHIDILPLFLNSGNHVQKDIPLMVQEARKKYGAVHINLLKHIGSHPGYLKLVMEVSKHTEAYQTERD